MRVFSESGFLIGQCQRPLANLTGMNKSPLPNILLAILAGIAVWSGVLCYLCVSRARETRNLQMETAKVVLWHQQWQQKLLMLGNESAEYAKRHPAMEQLLRSMTTTQSASNQTTTAPKSAQR